MLSVVGASSVLTAGCKANSALTVEGGSDGVVQNCPIVSRYKPPCAGSVTFDGTTPFGQFRPDSITIELPSNCNAQQRTVMDTTISDSHTGDHLYFRFVEGEDGLPFVGDHTVTVEVFSKKACSQRSPAGTLSISEGEPPTAAWAAGAGMLRGTLSLVSDGFSLAGTLQAPYCPMVECGL